MKQFPLHLRSSKQAGFTLVELLVVIGIIAILASVLITAAGPAIRAAERAKAANTASQIQTAALAYYTEYSVYPVPTATTTDIMYGDSSGGDGASWATLLCVLSGNIHPSDGTAFTPPGSGPTNTRAIAFLNLKSSDVCTAADQTSNPNLIKDAPKNPLPTNTTTALFFNIAFDSDYSGVIGDATSALYNTKIPNFSKSTPAVMDYTGVSTAGIAVWANCNGSATSTNPNFWVKTY
jgi:prepilin-type N-terminal cleavage/methylation domain-containing protein